MFEFHGWVTIQDAAGEGDAAATRRAAELIEERAGALGIGPGVADVRWVNGMAQCHVAGFANRRAAGGDDAIALFWFVAETAPGSYGLLYVQDDEDPMHGSVFRVGVLRRGRLTWEADPFLSPVVPTIEDPD